MPWFRFYANHGPGHQSHYEKYEYFTEGWCGRDELMEFWHDWCRVEFLEGAIGDVEPVEELPAHVRAQKIGIYRAKIKEALSMLMILGVEEEDDEITGRESRMEATDSSKGP